MLCGVYAGVFFCGHFLGSFLNTLTELAKID